MKPGIMAEEPRYKRRKQANPRRKNGNSRAHAHTNKHARTRTHARTHQGCKLRDVPSRAASDGADRSGPLSGLARAGMFGARGPVAAPRAPFVFTRSHASQPDN